MEKALAYLHDAAESFPRAVAPVLASPATVVYRDGQLELDNGVLPQHDAARVYFTGEGPATDGQLQAERGRGARTSSARRSRSANARLAAQPLTPQSSTSRRSRGQQLDVVVGSSRAAGRSRPTTRSRSSCAKPLHGVVPNVVGLRLGRARGASSRG